MSEKLNLLLVDDEERILRSLAMLFRNSYNVLTTTDPHQALAAVSRGPVHVVVSDQKMPVMRGAELLRQIKERSPNSMRLLLTGYSEMDAVLASVNEGEIFRFINKPWDAQELRDSVDQAAQIAVGLFNAAAAPAAVVIPAASRKTILVIDDDAEVYNAVQEITGSQAHVQWAASLDEALASLESHDVSVIVSELSVRGQSIVTFLKLLKAQHPAVVSIVLTPFQDVGLFIGLINQGQVYRLLPKPVRRGPLGMNIASALRHHQALLSMPQLRAAHAVQKVVPPAEDSNMAMRVMGMLGRLRNRALAS